MTGNLAFLSRLLRNSDGSAVVETVLVAPILMAMSVGSYEMSRIIARQSELQAASDEVSYVALATEPTSATRRATLKTIIQTSTGLPAEKVIIDAAYRCGSATNYVTAAAGCGTSRVSSFAKITLTDSYSPVWTQYGLGSTFTFSVTRYIMIKQQTTEEAANDD